MAILNTVTAHRISPLYKPITDSKNSHTVRLSNFFPLNKPNPLLNSTFSTKKRLNWIINSVAEEQDLAPAKTNDSKLHQEEDLPRLSLDGSEDTEGLSSSSSSLGGENYEFDGLRSRTINAAVVLAGGTLAITRLLTIDHDYWHVREP